MPAPFITPVRRAVRRAVTAPLWLGAVAAGVALTSTVVVAEHRHDVAPVIAPAVADTAPQTVRSATTLREAPERRPEASRSGVRGEPRLPLAPHDAGEIVAAAKSSTVNLPGRCLTWSREQAGIPSKYVDAATAWHYATGRRPGDADPPRGAAVYWTGGTNGYGHVAISVGNGIVRSSDAAGAGRVGTIKIEQLTKEWGLHYAGWANSINGYRIPGVAAA